MVRRAPGIRRAIDVRGAATVRGVTGKLFANAAKAVREVSAMTVGTEAAAGFEMVRAAAVAVTREPVLQHQAPSVSSQQAWARQRGGVHPPPPRSPTQSSEPSPYSC